MSAAAAAGAGAGDAVEMVTLVSEEGQTFSVPKRIASISGFIATTIDEAAAAGGAAANRISVQGVTAPVLTKVIAFMTHQVDEKMTELEKVRADRGRAASC